MVITIKIPGLKELRGDILALQGQVASIAERINTMATQADIDALVTRINDLGTALGTALAGIQSDLDALKAANPGVDTTALEASVGNLAGLVTQASAIDAENPV